MGGGGAVRQNPLKKFEDPMQLKKFPTPLVGLLSLEPADGLSKKKKKKKLLTRIGNGRQHR